PGRRSRRPAEAPPPRAQVAGARPARRVSFEDGSPEARSMPFANVNGQRLYYEVAGAGEMAVLLHGAYTDADIMEAPATGLASGFRVLRIDRRGHGRSQQLTQAHSLADEAVDVAALLDWFGEGYAHILSHDEGSEIAIE